jgi:hypothetical protein
MAAGLEIPATLQRNNFSSLSATPFKALADSVAH